MKVSGNKKLLELWSLQLCKQPATCSKISLADFSSLTDLNEIVQCSYLGPLSGWVEGPHFQSPVIATDLLCYLREIFQSLSEKSIEQEILAFFCTH